MALSAVGTVVGKLADTAVKNALQLYDVSDLIEPMKMELNGIFGLLRDADANCYKNPPVKEWVNELTVMAYRIEDALDTFLVGFEGKKRRNNSMIRKLMRARKKPKKVNILCDEIKIITGLLKTLHERGTEMGFKYNIEENHPISTQFKPNKPSNNDDSEVIGLDSEKKKIIDLLLDMNMSRLTVLSIVGTGGLGKTTLAQKVYQSVELEDEFDCRIWLSISQKVDENNLLRQILFSVEPKKEDQQPPVRDQDLLEEVEKALSMRRYLIILDDVRTIELWEQLKFALPDRKNASRVLITTRDDKVAMAPDCNTKQFKLCKLNDDQSLALLFKKAFQQSIQPHNYPKLESIAKNLIEKCGGLPLAIIVLGGILSRKDSDDNAWEEVESTLDGHDGQGAENWSKILALSYEDLPYELKPCFLYFASFPEDYEISANHITKMWVAEGFIPKNGARTMEDRAKDFLEELVERGLIHVTEKLSSGRCKTCKMHDLLRDIATHEAMKDNFLNVFSEAQVQSQVDITQTRRAALQHCTHVEYDLLSKTRTIICFGKQILYYQGFSLLRVLNFDRNDSYNYIHARKQAIHEGWLKCLIHLKFMGFRRCKNYFGFGKVSFSYLNNLETFDITGTLIEDVRYNIMDEPNDSLWEVPTLRNVISTYPIRGPSQWDHLQNLQTLKWARLEDVPVLTNSINLRKLGVHIIDPDILERPVASVKRRGPVKRANGKVNQSILAGSSTVDEKNVWHILEGLLKRTWSLTSLSVRSQSDKLAFGPNGTHDLPCHGTLHKLSLDGQWVVALTIEMLPTNLVKLTLTGSELKEDPMPILERLQSLQILLLLENSYTGRKMICSEGGFPSLEILTIEKLRNLSEWKIKKGAMPILNHLTIRGCDHLHIPPGLQNVLK